MRGRKRRVKSLLEQIVAAISDSFNSHERAARTVRKIESISWVRRPEGLASSAYRKAG